jgi:hypothetical protein
MKSETHEDLAQLAAKNDISIEELEAFTNEDRRNNAHASLGILPQRWLAYQWNIDNRQEVARDKELLNMQEEYVLAIKNNSFGLAVFDQLVRGLYALDVAEMHAWLFAYAKASGVDIQSDPIGRDRWQNELKASYSKSIGGRALYTLVLELTVGLTDEERKQVDDYADQRFKGHNFLAILIKTKVFDYIHDGGTTRVKSLSENDACACLTLLSMVHINPPFEATFMFMIASFANYVLGSTAHGKEMAETIEFAKNLVTELLEKGKELSKEVE